MLRNLTILSLFVLAAPAIAQEAASAVAPAPETDIAAAVAADWPKYDQGGKGHLTQQEFVTWLTALRGQKAGAAEDPARVKSWADAAFARTDANANKQVSPEELTAFLKEKAKKQ